LLKEIFDSSLDCSLGWDCRTLRRKVDSSFVRAESCTGCVVICASASEVYRWLVRNIPWTIVSNRTADCLAEHWRVFFARGPHVHRSVYILWHKCPEQSCDITTLLCNEPLTLNTEVFQKPFGAKKSKNWLSKDIELASQLVQNFQILC